MRFIYAFFAVLFTASIAAAQAPPKEPPPLWDVQVGASFVGTSGNSDTSSTGADFALHRRWPVWQIESAASAVKTSSQSVETAERYLFGLRGQRKLTSILGLSLTLERTPEMPDADRGDLLRRLAQNASKLDRLLKDLLDIDRLNRGIVEPQYRVTDVGALARRTVESLDILTGREVVAEADAVVIPVDPAKVERIVENLLMNAARHTAPDRRIWLKVTARDGGVAITVEDDGPGVPAEIRGAIFEPFRQGPTASPHGRCWATASKAPPRRCAGAAASAATSENGSSSPIPCKTSW